MLWKKANLCSITQFSSKFIDVEVSSPNSPMWRLTEYYGFSERSRRKEAWDMIWNPGLRSSLPWCLMGDFNEILSIGDKKGGVEHPPWLLRGFRSTLSNCSLCDFQLEGYPYTWAQGRGTNEAIKERLDRAIVSMTWLNTFPNARIQNLRSHPY